MAIRKRGKTWHYRFKIGGKSYEGSTDLPATKENYQAAVTAEAEARLQAEGKLPERPAVPDEKLFAFAADEFLRWCRTTKYRTKPATARRIATSFASLKAYFAGATVKEITPIEIERFSTHRLEVNQVKPITLRHDLHNLSLFMQYAVKAGWARDNTTRSVEKPSDADANTFHVVTPEEEQAYFRACSGTRTIHDVARLMLLQGPRPDELLSRRKEDVDLQAGVLLIRGGKTRAAKRKLFLTGEAVEILRERLKLPGEWLFPGKDPARHVYQLNSRHDQICQDAGVSFRLYDFRHTFATRFLEEAEGDVVTLANILGHSNLRCVMKYAHPTEEHQRNQMKRYEKKVRPILRQVK